MNVFTQIIVHHDIPCDVRERVTAFNPSKSATKPQLICIYTQSN